MELLATILDMNTFLMLISVLCTNPVSAKMIKETIYTGKLDQAKLNTTLIVSKFYAVRLNEDKSPSFVYDLRSELKNEDLQVGYYKATAFSMIPSISSKLAISLKTIFTQIGEFKIDGETISFEGELAIDKTKIGSIKYEFNMYDLPIRRIYNPKVTRTMENTKDGFIIVENREI